MAIYYDDIKLMKSERLDDTPEGGGRMTGHEVVDGEMNNLFPDVSRLDRTYGRVNLRKAFPAVLSLTQDVYYGAHLIITRPPGDQKIHCAMFTTKDSLDRRENAQKYIESYLDVAYRKPAYLVGAYPQGISVIQVYQAPGEPGFKVNQVIYLQDFDRGNPIDGTGEFNRVVSVEAYPGKEVIVKDLSTGTPVTVNVDKYILHLERPLQHDHVGNEPVNFFYPTTGTYIYATVAGASAKYYGISELAEPASVGDLSVKAKSIWTHIVPTARTEIALAAKNVTGQDGDLFPCAAGEFEVTFSGFANGSVAYLPFPVIPTSVSGSFHDEPYGPNSPLGALKVGGSTVGKLNYYTGTIQWTSSGSGTYTLRFYPAKNLTAFTYRAFEKIEAENRRNTYILTMIPRPTTPTVKFAYRAQGNWYILKDQGDGQIKGSDPNFGSGVYDAATYTGTVTTGALPDLDSYVYWEWMSVPELFLLNYSPTEKLSYSLDFGKRLEPNGVSVTYVAGGETKTVTDDGNGNLQGDGEGKVFYEQGTLVLYPTYIPDADQDIVVTSTKYEPTITSGILSEIASYTEPYWTFEAGEQILPGSVIVRYNVNIFRPYMMHRAWTRTFRPHDPPVYAIDDGSGNLVSMFGDNVGSVNYSTGTIQIASIQPYHRYAAAELDTKRFSRDSFFTGPPDQRPSQLYKPGITYQAALALVVSQMEQPREHYRYWCEWKSAFTAECHTMRYRVGYMKINGNTAALFSYVPASATSASETQNFPSRPILWAMQSPPGYADHETISFKFGGTHYFVAPDKTLREGFDYTTGEFGPQVGTYDDEAALIKIEQISGGQINNSPTQVTGLFMYRKPTMSSVTFVTDASPLIPGSFQLIFPGPDGNTITATADLSGVINSDFCQGSVDYETGICAVKFGKWEPHKPEYESESWFDESLLNEDGTQVFVPYLVDISEVTYNAVAYKFIPLDPSILGLDPIRLPPDGRVPIFHVGDVIVIHNIQQTTLPNPVQPGQTYDLGRTNLSYVDIFDQEGRYVNRNLYTVDLTNGQVTFADPLDLSGYTQPLVAYHRREDMRLVSDVQINGVITFTEPLDHDYPTDGNSFVSSALLMGDLQARVLNVFDQKNWYGRFRDSLEGDPAEATYNLIDYPIEVTNKGAIQERWAIVFTSSTTFKVIGENVGVIATGNVNEDCAPINPATGEPYFRIRREGWGSGWATNNVLRFNTTAAHYPVWFVRTTLQGDPEGEGDSFRVQIRGDSD